MLFHVIVLVGRKGVKSVSYVLLWAEHVHIDTKPNHGCFVNPVTSVSFQSLLTYAENVCWETRDMGTFTFIFGLRP